MASKKEVATLDESKALAAYDYGSMSGEGSEGTTPEDISIPFIALLQPLSPQVSGDSAIDGAKAGDFLNTVTNEITPGKQGFLFQPCYRDHCYIEWVPKDAGGGFVGRHELDSDVVRDAIADNNGSKYGGLHVGNNELVETVYIYGLLLDETGTEVEGFAVLPCWSTKLKPLRAAWTQYTILKGKPPLYAMRWRITSKGDKNKKGQPFSNYAIDAKAMPLLNPADPTEMAMLKEAQVFRSQVASGQQKADLSAQANASYEDKADQETPF